MAISSDLRSRAVEAYERGEGPVAGIAARFSVGEASLWRWLRRKREIGSVDRFPRAGGSPRRVSLAGEALLREWLAEDPSVSQSEMAARLVDAGQPSVVQQTVGVTLARMGITFKKNLSGPSSGVARTS
jgi:transposase